MNLINAKGSGATSKPIDILRRGAVVLDTETTGLEPYAEACDIAVVNAISGAVLFSSLIRPTVEVGAKAAAVHGISYAMTANAPNFSSIWPALRAAVLGKVIVTYNAEFDRRILLATARGVGCGEAVAFFESAAWFCCMLAFAGGGRWLKLETAAELSNVKALGTHRAEADAATARGIFLRMAGVI